MPPPYGTRMVIGSGMRAAGAVAHPGDVADQLLERRVGEGVELHLDDRPQPVHRHADGRAEDARLGERGVRAAVLAELLGESVGDPEDAAEGADVLAHDVHGRVVGHGVAQRAVEGLRHGGGLARGRRLAGSSPARAPAVPACRASVGSASSSARSRAACSRSWRCGLGVDVGEQVHRVEHRVLRSSARAGRRPSSRRPRARPACRRRRAARARSAPAPAGRSGRAPARPRPRRPPR